MIKFTADLEPVPFPRPASNLRRRFNPKRYNLYKDVIGHLANIAMRGQAPLSGEVKLSVDFYRPKPKQRKGKPEQVSFIGDVDNYLKAVMDSLIGICYVDDRQVTDVRARKFFGSPRVIIEVEDLSRVN